MSKVTSLMSCTEPTGVEWFFAAVGDRLIRYALSAKGDLRTTDTLFMPLPVQYACLDSARGLQYVVCSNGGVGRMGDRHCLVRVAVDRPLRALEAPVQLPHRPIHVSLSRGGRRLFIAYNLPAAFSVIDLDATGRVSGEVTALGGEALAGWFPHQILPIPGRDNAVLLTCRGDDATPERAENPGSLRVLCLDESQPRVSQVVAPRGGYGFGPRNCGFHPRLPWLYAVLERQNALVQFDLQDGRIAGVPACTVGLLQRPELVSRPQLAGALELHPGGHVAYVVNRSHAVVLDGPHAVWGQGENSIVVLRLDPATGAPTPVQFMPLQGLHARCMAIVHGGRMLVAAIRQDSLRRTESGLQPCPAGFSIFRIRDDGQLTAIAHVPEAVGDAQIFWAGAGC